MNTIDNDARLARLEELRAQARAMQPRPGLSRLGHAFVFVALSAVLVVGALVAIEGAAEPAPLLGVALWLIWAGVVLGMLGVDGAAQRRAGYAAGWESRQQHNELLVERAQLGDVVPWRPPGKSSMLTRLLATHPDLLVWSVDITGDLRGSLRRAEPLMNAAAIASAQRVRVDILDAVRRAGDHGVGQQTLVDQLTRVHAIYDAGKVEQELAVMLGRGTLTSKGDGRYWEADPTGARCSRGHRLLAHRPICPDGHQQIAEPAESDVPTAGSVELMRQLRLSVTGALQPQDVSAEQLAVTVSDLTRRMIDEFPALHADRVNEYVLQHVRVAAGRYPTPPYTHMPELAEVVPFGSPSERELRPATVEQLAVVLRALYEAGPGGLSMSRLGERIGELEPDFGLESASPSTRVVWLVGQRAVVQRFRGGQVRHWMHEGGMA